MANMLRQSLSMTIPVVIRGDSVTLFEVSEAEKKEAPVLFLYIDFTVRNRNISGYIAVLMSLPSLLALKHLISAFISRVIEGDG
jgi:chemotaxis protein CheC